MHKITTFSLNRYGLGTRGVFSLEVSLFSRLKEDMNSGGCKVRHTDVFGAWYRLGGTSRWLKWNLRA